MSQPQVDYDGMEADDTDRFAKTSLESFDVAQGTDDVVSKWILCLQTRSCEGDC